MLNHIVKAASGNISHTALFDAMFGVERPDFLTKCPVDYINPGFEKMANIVDIKVFKKEASAGFEKMGLDTDAQDHILEAIADAKTASEVARVIYGAGVYLLTEYIGEKDELRNTLATRWMAEAKDMETTADGFYTVEAENAMKAICQEIFEGANATVDPIAATAAPVEPAAPVADAATTEQTQEQKGGAKKGGKNHTNK